MQQYPPYLNKDIMQRTNLSDDWLHERHCDIINYRHHHTLVEKKGNLILHVFWNS